MWYRLVRGGRYLRVAPWDLASAPLFWLHAAEQAVMAEHHAEKVKASRRGR